MTNRPKNPIKRVAIDIAGFGLLLAALLTGWLPGPGGIPLAIAGLSLLAINYEWASRLQDSVKTKGLEFADRVFPDNPNIQLMYDLATFLLLSSAVLLYREHRWQIAVVLAGIAVGIFCLNRKRAARFGHIISSWFKHTR